MKKLCLAFVCAVLSWINTYALVEEHIQFSLYHNSADGPDQFRIRLRTDTSAYWDGTRHALNIFQVPIRFLDSDSLKFSVSNTGLPFHSGQLQLLAAINDPSAYSYTLQRLYYDGGTTSPDSGIWAKNTEYDLAIITITGGEISREVQLPNETAQKTGAYIYTQFDGADYMTNYSAPFYGNTTSLSGWEYADLAGTALPVSLVDLTAEAKNGADAELSWQTATEENNRGFYIERSTDGANWEEIAFTPSQAPNGNSRIRVDYRQTDMNVYDSHTGVNIYYYRLRQQDFNGTQEYVGDIKAVQFNTAGATAQVQVYPNPASSFVNVRVDDGMPNRCSIYDMNGKCVMQSGYADKLDISALRSGSYQIMVFDIVGARLGAQNISVVR